MTSPNVPVAVVIWCRLRWPYCQGRQPNQFWSENRLESSTSTSWMYIHVLDVVHPRPGCPRKEYYIHVLRWKPEYFGGSIWCLNNMISERYRVLQESFDLETGRQCPPVPMSFSTWGLGKGIMKCESASGIAELICVSFIMFRWNTLSS